MALSIQPGLRYVVCFACGLLARVGGNQSDEEGKAERGVELHEEVTGHRNEGEGLKPGVVGLMSGRAILDLTRKGDQRFLKLVEGELQVG